jgi:hypothetical protein
LAFLLHFFIVDVFFVQVLVLQGTLPTRHGRGRQFVFRGFPRSKPFRPLGGFVLVCGNKQNVAQGEAHAVSEALKRLQQGGIIKIDCYPFYRLWHKASSILEDDGTPLWKHQHFFHGLPGAACR